MAIENNGDLYSHWADVASWWYIKATNKRPEFRRLYHLLGILQRPNLQKFTCYGQSQTCVIPFSDTKDSMSLLCTPLVKVWKVERTATRSAEASLCKMFTLTYLGKPPDAVNSALELALDSLDRPGNFCWKKKGVALATASTSTLFGHEPSQTYDGRHTIQLFKSTSAARGLGPPPIPLQ